MLTVVNDFILTAVADLLHHFDSIAALLEKELCDWALALRAGVLDFSDPLLNALDAVLVLAAVKCCLVVRSDGLEADRARC